MHPETAAGWSLADYHYELPEELIAQTPPSRRDDARLMVLDRARGALNVEHFPDIVGHLRAGDLLVMNDTRVIPARLLGHKQSGGQVEVLLVRRLAGADEVWQCLTRSNKPLRPGTLLTFADDLSAEVAEVTADGHRLVRFACATDFAAVLERVGHIPLPPYIRREDDRADRDRYQTVFARNPGAVAAPTAGLHFTPEILAALAAHGVECAQLTLHVGLGTFLPVRVEDPRQHRMHAERYEVPEATAVAVNRARAEGRRIIALGTTSARTLESAVAADGRLRAGEGESALFIYPPYRFRLVDGLVTNFHLPQSTLLMLVAALAGRTFVLQAYRRAVEERFRFFSYGDCMLIL